MHITSPTKGVHPDYDEGAVPYTSPVGSFPANGYGLHDMAGNMAEWVWGWYADYVAGAQTDPQGPSSGTARIYRGGELQHRRRQFVLRRSIQHVFAGHRG